MAWTPYEQSVERLEKSFTCKGAIEVVGLMESLGRVLAKDIIAKENQPAFPTSEMDGYAIRFIDQEKGILKLTHHVPAGTQISLHVKGGECIKTFTGSLLSEGADTIIPIENVEVEGENVRIVTPVKQGFAVRPIGEGYREGEVLIPKGTKIGFAQIGVLAGLGEVQVSVFVRPKVAILATGSEIVDLGQPLPTPAHIRSSNHVTIAALAQNAGAQPIVLGLAGDDKELIKKRIIEGLQCADIVVTTGGVSVGDYDFVKDIIGDLAMETIIEGADIKPGRHVRVVKVGEKYILALPGFPYSSAVVFGLYGLRLVDWMLGLEYERRFCAAILEEDYPKRSKFTEFTACNLVENSDQLMVNLEGKKLGSSAILNNLLGGATLLCIPKETTLLKKGEKVKVLRLEV
jgi:molybdopterin molybdotransferase